ncbi:MAG: CD1871A family CXXC motif-containing protein [Acidobacteriota bacterium]|nr:CD1871A family CXXC motif-containing protein [Acidobacteriota bacterium]MDW3228489.1 CD1871A family CXXC motif-containing protein [Acidobacteriota bacterium]MDY0231956.1 CD1871A family CXXC motif-containing protein [Candidatus Saccharicenans sp.]
MKKRKFWFFCLLIIAVSLIVLGLFDGEFKTVWQKASTICLECIGIG